MAPATASASPSAGLVSSPPVDAPAITAVPTNAITIPTQPRAEVCSPISGPASATQIGIVCTKTELAAIDVYDSDETHAAKWQPSARPEPIRSHREEGGSARSSSRCPNHSIGSSTTLASAHR